MRIRFVSSRARFVRAFGRTRTVQLSWVHSIVLFVFDSVCNFNVSPTHYLFLFSDAEWSDNRREWQYIRRVILGLDLLTNERVSSPLWTRKQKFVRACNWITDNWIIGPPHGMCMASPKNNLNSKNHRNKNKTNRTNEQILITPLLVGIYNTKRPTYVVVMWTLICVFLHFPLYSCQRCCFATCQSHRRSHSPWHFHFFCKRWAYVRPLSHPKWSNRNQLADWLRPTTPLQAESSVYFSWQLKRVTAISIYIELCWKPHQQME